MKKYTKLFSVLILSSILALGFYSCSDDDGYSLDKYWVNIATINKIGDNTYDFTLDNGKKLWVAAPIGLNLNPKYDRTIINYTLLSGERDGYDHYIKLNRIYEILTKKPVYIAFDNQEEQDSIGNDFIKVHSMWEGGGYLNIHFGYNIGGGKTHMLNLLSDKEDLGINDDVVKLEFRHNKNGDRDDYGYNGYVSFDLSPYKMEGKDKVTFEISWTDFKDQMKTKTIEYDLSGDNSQPEESIDITTNENTNLNIY